MEHLDLTTLADRAGVPLEAARRYRDAYVLFIPAIRVGRTIGFPVEAIDVIRLIAERESAGDDPWTIQSVLEATYPVTVLSAQPIAPGDLASPHAPVLELLRGVDTRYAALAAQVASLSETVAQTVAAGRPAEELAEIRTMLAAAQTAIDTATAASAAGQDRTVAAHQTLLTGSASMAATTHAEHQVLLAALERQRDELAAIREQQARVQADLAAIQPVVSSLATAQQVEWMGTGLTQLGQRLTAQIGEHLPTGSDRDQMTAHIATQTADGVGTLLDKRETTLMAHIDAQLTALARHVESRVAQLDRRVSAIASLPSDGGAAQAALLERITTLTRQITDEAIIQNAAIERIASERDETTRLMSHLVAEAIATIRQEVRAGAALAMSGQSATPAAAHLAVQATNPLDAHPHIQIPSSSGQPLVTAQSDAAMPSSPASQSDQPQRPNLAQTWTDHLVAINGITASGTPGHGTASHGTPGPDPTTIPGASPTVDPAPSPRVRPTTEQSWTRTPTGSTTGLTGGPSDEPTGAESARVATTLPSTPTPPSNDAGQAAPAKGATQPGLPNRRRLGHPHKTGDLSQSG